MEYFLPGQILTHGRSHLWLCRGHRWTRKRTGGAGGRQEWLAVGGWPVRPYHQTPSAPVPPLPASPSAPCGRLCRAPDAHPDGQKQIIIIYFYCFGGLRCWFPSLFIYWSVCACVFTFKKSEYCSRMGVTKLLKPAITFLGHLGAESNCKSNTD